MFPLVCKSAYLLRIAPPEGLFLLIDGKSHFCSKKDADLVSRGGSTTALRLT